MRTTFERITETLDRLLAPERNYDMLRKTMEVGSTGKKAVLYYIEGFVKDDLTLKVLEYLTKAESTGELMRSFPQIKVRVLPAQQTDEMVTAVLSGALVLCVEGEDSALEIDTRQYPARSLDEPENDKVLRGARDGFTETLMVNLKLIRRRVRDPRLRVTHVEIGTSTRTDVTMCYVEGLADPEFTRKMEEKLRAIRVSALNLGQQSLAECLITTRWYNPFPKIRYTERPDVCAASLLEGSVIVLCDNSPMAMLLPTSIFDFVQECDDFYFPPCVGSYLRLLRTVIFFLTLTLSPTWYFFIRNPDIIPRWLAFIHPDKPGGLPVIVQLLLVEFAVDGLKMASMNTPSTLNSSLSIVGGLILGDFAVDAGLLTPEVILIMAFVAITNFTPSSYELGYAFKLLRMAWLALTALFSGWGYAAGWLLTVLSVACNKTVDGSRGYLYPLLPFSASAMGRLLLRQPLKSKDGRDRGSR